MPTLRIVDSLSDSGSSTRQNEDEAGWNGAVAFVIDGATGLGGKALRGAGSDAAWLAGFARQMFEREIDATVSMQAVVRALNEHVARQVAQAAGDAAVEPWALPTASFQLVRVEGLDLVAYGLGDCRLFLSGADGALFETNEAFSEAETRAARRAVAEAGGLAAWRSLAEAPAVREALRRSRARHNQPGGTVWTLGCAPEAADHLDMQRIVPSLPARGLLCSDGFSAIADKYGRYDGASLIRAASDRGLGALMAELREIEREEDPDGRKFPRFKVSDDATALLFEVLP